MSETIKRPPFLMMRAAEGIVQEINTYCQRVEIAGSLRRCKPSVGDIEIICIPQPVFNLFGEATGDSQLDQMLDLWMAEGRLQHVVPKCWGQKYKAFQYVRGGQTYKVDLFIQTADTWGVNYMIRTGSADFTRRMVTKRNQGGLMPNDLSVSDARVWRNGAALSTPEEHDVFDLWGMAFVEPKERI